MVLAGAVAFRVLRKLKRDLKSIVGATQQLASGDLTANIQARENGDEVDEVKLTVAQMNAKLSGIVGSVKDLSEHLRTSAAAEEQNATLADITNTVNDVNAITEENTQRARLSLGSTESLNQLSQELLDSVSYFRV